jgi:hypothetical protein
MEVLDDNLPFRVEQWDAAGGRFEAILAAVADLKLGKAAFAEAVNTQTNAYYSGTRHGSSASTRVTHRMSTELTKIDVAKAQLEEALRLRLADGNSIAVHTLAYASFGILRDLINHQEHPMNDVLGILEDHASKMGREFWQVPNSLKHADRNPSCWSLTPTKTCI